MKANGKVKVAIGLALSVLAAAGLALWLLSQKPVQASVGLRSAAPTANVLPAIFPVSQFSFPDQDGTQLSTQSLRGKVWIADFIFTHCGNTCPLMTTRSALLQKQINDPRVMFLSISVDPQRDDRATRKSYAADHQIDESRWRFVCPPDRDAAFRIAQSMKIGAIGHDLNSPILHSDRFILIDAECRVRGTYALEDEEAMSRLVNDARSMANDVHLAKTFP